MAGGDIRFLICHNSCYGRFLNRLGLWAKSSRPRYLQVEETLRREMTAGKYHPGQKLPSEAALVNRFGVSRITVGRALHELQRVGLIAGIAGSGKSMREVSAAPGSPLFGLLIPNLGETDIFEAICRGMAASPEPHALLWGSNNADLIVNPENKRSTCVGSSSTGG